MPKVLLGSLCYFEEVYKNGDVQKGIFLNSNNKIRYEYNDINLFTIIYADQRMFVLNNKDRNEFDEILDKQRLSFFQTLTELITNYPNIEKKIINDNIVIEIEESSNRNFPKRIAIKSNKINLSIYLKDCVNQPINDLFFKHDPLFDYPR